MRRAPYERTQAGRRTHRRIEQTELIERMNDIPRHDSPKHGSPKDGFDAGSTAPAAATLDAVALGGVNLSLGRGAARVHILKDIDLHIRRGEAVALLGPSGSGKSTLLMVMTGLERPDSGSVTIAGQALLGLDEDRLARFRGKNVGIVFQAFY
jgi:ABC-type transport system involved in cytochrome bd biosynthesis fused ATPase/permease subunit